MKRPILLEECVHHEIALLGVPEVYRVKLAFLAGFRHALEASATDLVRKHCNDQDPPRDYFKALAVCKAINGAQFSIFDEAQSIYGTAAANRILNSNRNLFTRVAFNDFLQATIKDCEANHERRFRGQESAPDPASPTPDQANAAPNPVAPPTAGATREASAEAPQASGPTTQECDCVKCQFVKSLNVLVGTVFQSA